MSFNQLLRLLVMLLALGAFAGGALAAQPIVDDGPPAAVYAEGDGGDDEGEGDGEGEDDEGQGELAPTSDETAEDETEEDEEKGGK